MTAQTTVAMGRMSLTVEDVRKSSIVSSVCYNPLLDERDETNFLKRLLQPYLYVCKVFEHLFELVFFCLSLDSDTRCTDLTYKCSNNKCISKVNPECDGTPDCEDGSDEANCGTSA